MIHKTKMSKAKKAARQRAKTQKPRQTKSAATDNVNTAMKRAVAHTLANSVDHMPYDLGYSFK